MPPQIIYEDKNFLAINKPAILLVHPLKTKNYNLKTEPTLVDWLVKKYPEIKKVGDEPQVRPGIVHRLDKDTSGVILIARNQDYFNYLKKLFKERKIKKIYLALVWGKVAPKTGIIKKPISLKNDTVKRTVWKGEITKEAVTEYKALRYYQRKSDFNQRKSATFSLLKVIPETGRTHQIRVHLASIGHPVVGDALYGPKENPFGLNRQFLHAESLEFSEADGKRIKIEAALPEDLKLVLKKLTNE